MIPLLIVIDVIASCTLILFILLHAGREAAAFSDMFGGGMNTQLGGSTVVERNLDRLTVAAPRCSASPACCWPSCSSPRESPSVAAGRRAFRWLLVGGLVAAACTGRVRLVRTGPAAGERRPVAAAAATARHRPARPRPLDPARADRLEDEIVLGSLFDGLTAIDPAGAVRPAVAASWTSDPSLRRWEFRLRPDARWSDGSPVRSTDFTYAWQRLADPKAEPAPSPARTLLFWASPATGPSPPVSACSIAGLETLDPATLVVRPTAPFADLPALVAAIPLGPRCPRPWPAPTRPPTWPTRPATAPSAWPPPPARAALTLSAAPPTRPRRRCSTRSPSMWSPTSRPPGWSSRTAGRSRPRPP